ncbi:MAG: ATP-binding cassette domain-containing protein [Candidatus Dormibacteria bacterium]
MAKASLSAGVSRELAVFVSNLHKSYGSVQAVCGIDLEIERGQIVALLGPNGAGKTTTWRSSSG